MNFNHQIRRKDVEESHKPPNRKNKFSNPKEKASNYGIQKKTSTKRKRKYVKNAWTKAEKNRYITFLKNNKKLLESPPQIRKRMQINVQMSEAIRSRQKGNCHSFHQKMMARYKTIQNIIQNLSKNDRNRLKPESTDEMKMMRQQSSRQCGDAIEQQNLPEEIQPIIYQVLQLGIYERKDEHGSIEEPRQNFPFLSNTTFTESANSKEYFTNQDIWFKSLYTDHS